MERLYPNVKHVILLLTSRILRSSCFGLCILNFYIILHTELSHQICHKNWSRFIDCIVKFWPTVKERFERLYVQNKKFVNRPDVVSSDHENFCVTIRRFKFTLIRTANACHATNCLNDRKLVVLR